MRLISLLIISLALSACTQQEKESSTIIPQVQEFEQLASYFDLDDFQLYADESSLP